MCHVYMYVHICKHKMVLQVSKVIIHSLLIVSYPRCRMGNICLVLVLLPDIPHRVHNLGKNEPCWFLSLKLKKLHMLSGEKKNHCFVQ